MSSPTEHNPIVFRTALSADDYAAAVAIFEGAGLHVQKLDFPTILAFEDGRLIGACGTQLLPDMIVAGPMAVEPFPSGRSRMAVSLALCEYYEATLRSLGITSYIFSVDEGSSMAQSVAWYTPDNEPYAREGGKLFFVRHIDGRQRKRTGTV